MIYTCYVLDSNRDVKQMMRQNFDAWAVFMTIRTYNKFLKVKPENVKLEKEKTYLKIEEIDYLVFRFSKKDEKQY